MRFVVQLTAEAGPLRALVARRVVEGLVLVPIMVGVLMFLIQALDDDSILGNSPPPAEHERAPMY